MQRWEFLEKKVRKYNLKKGLEIGVKSGKTTFHLLKNFPELKMVAVDPWVRQDHPQAAANGQTKSYGHDRHPEYEARFRNRGAQYLKQGRLKIIKDFSHNCFGQFDDGHFDFIFIDGDHTYESCKQDIIDWRPKVRVGGLLCGHDSDWPGVTQAIQEEEPYYNINKGDNVWWVIKRETPTAHHNIVLKRDRVVFMLSARCGSRSFKSMIRGDLGYGKPINKDALMGLKYVSQETLLSEYSDYLKIAVVRNPYARLLSCYRGKVKRNLRPSIEYLGVKPGATFEQFCRVVHDTPDAIADGHFVSQSSVLLDPDGNLIPDHIFKIDAGGVPALTELKKLFKEQSGRSLPVALPHLNKANVQVDYRVKYSDEARELVAERYAEDLERLDYGF